MGNLTDDMNRLHDQICTWNESQHLLRKEMKQFVGDIHSHMCRVMAGSNAKRLDMASKLSADNQKFLQNTRKRVEDLRQETNRLRQETSESLKKFAQELCSAKQAWVGSKTDNP